MNVRIIFESDISEKLSTIWTLAHIRWTIVKQAMCRAPRVKSETKHAYHKIYLVYARHKIKHANANLDMKKELYANWDSKKLNLVT